MNDEMSKLVRLFIEALEQSQKYAYKYGRLESIMNSWLIEQPTPEALKEQLLHLFDCDASTVPVRGTRTVPVHGMKIVL